MSAAEDGTENCCNEGGGVFLENDRTSSVESLVSSVTAAITRTVATEIREPGIPQFNAPSSEAQTLTPSAGTTPTTHTSTPSPRTNSLDTSTVIGGVVGGVAGVVAISLTLWHFLVQRGLKKKPQIHHEARGSHVVVNQRTWQDPGELHADHGQGEELEAASVRQRELEG